VRGRKFASDTLDAIDRRDTAHSPGEFSSIALDTVTLLDIERCVGVLACYTVNAGVFGRRAGLVGPPANTTLQTVGFGIIASTRQILAESAFLASVFMDCGDGGGKFALWTEHTVCLHCVAKSGSKRACETILARSRTGGPQGGRILTSFTLHTIRLLVIASGGEERAGPARGARIGSSRPRADGVTALWAQLAHFVGVSPKTFEILACDAVLTGSSVCGAGQVRKFPLCAQDAVVHIRVARCTGIGSSDAGATV